MERIIKDTSLQGYFWSAYGVVWLACQFRTLPNIRLAGRGGGLGTPKGSMGWKRCHKPLKASSGQKIGVYDRAGLCRLCLGCLSGSFCGPLDVGKASGGGVVAENL